MADSLQAEVTTLLDEIRAGKAEAKSQLVELVYAELHGLASGLMRRERAGHTLQPTALVHEALTELAKLNERQGQVIELRFFGGYTVEEVAEQLDVSVTTVERDFRKACAYLRRRLLKDA